MAILRVLIIILFLVNLILFVIGQGWLGRGRSGEANRLQTQIVPETIRIVADGNNRPAATPPGPLAAVTPPPTSPAPLPSAPASTPVTPPAPAPTATPSAPVPAPAPAAPVAHATPPAPSAPAVTAQTATPPAPAPAATPKTPPAPATPPAPPAPVAAAPAPAPKKPAPRACRVVPALTEALTSKAMGVVKSVPTVKAEWKDAPTPPTSYWVHTPPLKSAQAAELRADEMRIAGVKDLYIVRDEGPFRHAIALGRFSSEKNAHTLQDELRKKGVPEAVITPAGMEMKHNLTLQGPADVVDSAISKLNANLGELRVTACE